MVFSNADITSSRLHNYKKMEQRRIVFFLGVIYGTPHQKLKEITILEKDIINKEDRATYNQET